MGFRGYNGKIVLNPCCIDPYTRNLVNNVLQNEDSAYPVPLGKQHGKESTVACKKRKNVERGYKRRVFAEVLEKTAEEDLIVPPLLPTRGSDTDEDSEGYDKELLKRRLRNKFFKHLREIHEDEIWDYDKDNINGQRKIEPLDFFTRKILNLCDGLTKGEIRTRVDRRKRELQKVTEGRVEDGNEEEKSAGTYYEAADEEILRQLSYHTKHTERKREPSFRDRLTKRFRAMKARKLREEEQIKRRRTTIYD